MLTERLNTLHGERGLTLVISGGACGADTLGAEWAKAHGIPCEVYMADWEGLGRKAGPIRNQRMLDEGKPDIVVAFPVGRGTADMVRRARAADIDVLLIARDLHRTRTQNRDG